MMFTPDNDFSILLANLSGYFADIVSLKVLKSVYFTYKVTSKYTRVSENN